MIATSLWIWPKALLTASEISIHDTIEEFNVDSKAEYSALSSTRSQQKKLKQTTPVPCPFNTVQVKIREVSQNMSLGVKIDEVRLQYLSIASTFTYKFL